MSALTPVVRQQVQQRLKQQGSSEQVTGTFCFKTGSSTAECHVTGTGGDAANIAIRISPSGRAFVATSVS